MKERTGERTEQARSCVALTPAAPSGRTRTRTHGGGSGVVHDRLRSIRSDRPTDSARMIQPLAILKRLEKVHGFASKRPYNTHDDLNVPRFGLIFDMGRLERARVERPAGFRGTPAEEAMAGMKHCGLVVHFYHRAANWIDPHHGPPIVRLLRDRASIQGPSNRPGWPPNGVESPSFHLIVPINNPKGGSPKTLAPSSLTYLMYTHRHTHTRRPPARAAVPGAPLRDRVAPRSGAAGV